MRDMDIEELYKSDNNKFERSGNSGPEKIRDFSPSMKLVLNILENNGPLTQKEIAEKTYLSKRTVRYAINRLKLEDILVESEYFLDARQCLYRIKY